MRITRPFRLGTTSYIIPDDIIPNALYLAGKVDDIQLILFESNDESNLPSAADIQKLKEIASKNNLTYSIHFPLDTSLGAGEPLRAESVKTHLRIIELTQPLAPSAYIMHLNGDDINDHGKSPSDNMPRWIRHNRKSIGEILASGIERQKICVETLSYPFALVEDIVREFNLSICLDIGHLILGGYSLENHLKKYMNQTRSIHLHGVKDGKDHCSIAHLPDSALHSLIAAINSSANPPTVTLEVFNEPDFLESMSVWENITT